MALCYATFQAPPGPLTLITEDETVVAAGFTTDTDALISRIPDGPPSTEPLTEGRLPQPAADAVAAYFDGDLTAWDGLAVARNGTSYHQQVWDLLRRVAPGEPLTYTELARRSSNPAAVRAAATACARNPIAPLVPCHRIVRNDGGLGGYAFGLDIKRWLLDHEARR